jgi:putative methyltransferase (TIGR04325 family)
VRGILSGLGALRGSGGISGLGLAGDYGSWEDALAASTGYDDEAILEKTRIAALAAKHGEVAFERDSVVFERPEYAWPLLAALMWVAAQNEGRLSVLDFGGSLGSTYFQHRVFLDRLDSVHWVVVEQSAHVTVGRGEFADERLRFCATIDEAAAESPPDVIVMSSVLQYLERPHEVLSALLDLECDHVVLDRTTVWNGQRDRLCVQKVPPEIYNASYPCWLLSEARLNAELAEAGYRRVADLAIEELRDNKLRYRESGALLGRVAGRST